ncbi:MAG: AraC family transcriptional regulator [Paenibacillus sp.]|nr:AraC family transcriptional regulator [Paenibacillus sp.]
MRLSYDGIGIELQGAGRVTPDPNWRIGAHSHEQYEIHFITEGIGVNQLDNGEIDLYPGVVYLAPPNETHAQYSDKSSPLGLYYIFFELQLPPHMAPLSRIYAPYNFSSGDLLSIFEMMNAGSGETGMGNRLLGRMHLIEMIWKVIDSRLQQAPAPSSFQQLSQHGKMAPLLEKAVLYIQQNFHRNPTVAEIAEACFVSERHLSRLFLRQLHLTVNQYVQSERLFYASTELKHTVTPLQDICEKLQFSSMQYFAHWFKGLSSMTPTEFRKKHQSG